MRRRLAVLAACGVLLAACNDALNAPDLDAPEGSGLQLSLDTLNVEVQNLWVRISAASSENAEVTVEWVLEAHTENPFWRPGRLTRTGGRSFSSPGTAKIWGNVPRAYDFQVIVTGLTADGGHAADTLVVLAPRCVDRARPGLICNPAKRSGREWERQAG